MKIPGLFKETLPTLEKAMNLRSARHNLIVSNIANMDTPNYKAFDLVMEEELGKISGSSGGQGLARTHPGHVGGQNFQVRRVTAESGELDNAARGDGNTVDVEKEMSKLTENGIVYNALAGIVSREFRILSAAVEGK